DQAGRVVAQVPEHERERDAAPFARVRQPLGVQAADLVGAGDDHRGHGRGGGGYLNGEPLHDQTGEDLAGRAAGGGVHRQAGVAAGFLRPAAAGLGGQLPQDGIKADQVGGDLLPVGGGEQVPGDQRLLGRAEQPV